MDFDADRFWAVEYVPSAAVLGAVGRLAESGKEDKPDWQIALEASRLVEPSRPAQTGGVVARAQPAAVPERPRPVEVARGDVAQRLVHAVERQTAVSAVGFAMVAAGLAQVKREQERTTAAALAIRGELEALRIEQRWLALRQSRALEAIHEHLIASRSHEARQLFEQGEANFAKGYYDEAFERFQKALSFDNTNALIHFYVGLCHAHRFEPLATGKSLKKAIDFAPENEPEFSAMCLGTYTRYLLASGDFASALLYSARTLEARPDESAGLLLRLEALLLAGELDEARSLTSVLVRRFPHHYYTLLASPMFAPHIAPLGPTLEAEFTRAHDAGRRVLAVVRSVNEEFENRGVGFVFAGADDLENGLANGLYHQIADVTGSVASSFERSLLAELKGAEQGIDRDEKRVVAAADRRYEQEVAKAEKAVGEIRARTSYIQVVGALVAFLVPVAIGFFVGGGWGVLIAVLAVLVGPLVGLAVGALIGRQMVSPEEAEDRRRLDRLRNINALTFRKEDPEYVAAGAKRAALRDLKRLVKLRSKELGALVVALDQG